MLGYLGRVSAQLNRALKAALRIVLLPDLCIKPVLAGSEEPPEAAGKARVLLRDVGFPEELLYCGPVAWNICLLRERKDINITDASDIEDRADLLLNCGKLVLPWCQVGLRNDEELRDLPVEA